MNDVFRIEWRSKEGYGDFITGLGYAHSSVIKYNRPVHINFHWPNSKDHLLSSADKEPIYTRFNHILSWFRPVNNLTITHKFNSIPKYRFINELEEFNPLHGLWYPNRQLTTESNLVVFWSSKHNLEFPGYHKDPLYDHWDIVVDQLKELGYNVVEVTYRTPIKEAMNLISRCEFGVGYEGMIHQLYKFMWKPLVVASQRVSLSRLLCAQAAIITEPKQLINRDIERYVSESKSNIKQLLIQHEIYMSKVQDPTMHELFNKEI
jgi:hypothetical protein